MVGSPAVLASFPSPSSNAIHIGDLQLRAYGLMIALGVFAAVWLSQKRCPARNIDPLAIQALALRAVPAGLIGARAYHVLTDWRSFEGRWFDVVKWSLFAMVEAEELGLTSKNIAEQAKNASPSIQRFVGASGELGSMLGLDNRWAFNIVSQVGNYGESFDANLKPLGFERGMNRLWTQGGLMYAPPIR